jgi:hypothetical protein
MLSMPMDLFHNNEQENRNFQNNVKNKSKSEKNLEFVCTIHTHTAHSILSEGLTPLYNRSGFKREVAILSERYSRSPGSRQKYFE